MMAVLDIDALARLEAKATPRPWHVCQIDDDMCMSMIVISDDPDIDDHGDLADAKHILAATLVQSPRYVDVQDGRWHENADLIATVRNALPELLRLARKGREAEAAAQA